jgi:uncharacterized FlaG/YvyC family protein
LKINGIDNLIVNRIKERTRKKIVFESDKTKITEDKHKEDKKEKEQKKSYQEKEFEETVEEINKLMKENNKPIFFKIITVQNKIKVQIINKSSKKILFLIYPDKVYGILEKLKNSESFILDETI